ncbi:hypothetical protein PHJA_001334700 [Phtheirospermum japonicum]|uniref:Uncharacterized protein n=1 Tax=Phtheirospermum japonicum TaxID=374723 RepID=A0A830BYP8_9LAMI|nr:hypothetical protein PHJA_001334700 [Phtheirospermum japonicum]
MEVRRGCEERRLGFGFQAREREEVKATANEWRSGVFVRRSGGAEVRRICEVRSNEAREREEVKATANEWRSGVFVRRSGGAEVRRICEVRSNEGYCLDFKREREIERDEMKANERGSDLVWDSGPNSSKSSPTHSSPPPSRPPPSPSLNLQTISSHLNSYDFRHSLIDIHNVSIIRSAIILFFAPRLSNGLYMGVATVCSAASLVFVSFKASYVFVSSNYGGFWGYSSGYVRAMVSAMFVSSLGLAIGQVVVAYRTSCGERRKLLVYKIDIEAEHLARCT